MCPRKGAGGAATLRAGAPKQSSARATEARSATSRIHERAQAGDGPGRSILKTLTREAAKA
jgi:hypothetical protein